MKATLQQAPIRNASTIAASIYSHSGEFAPDYTDLRLTGRGLDLEVIRSYRSSLADLPGELGRGWSISIAKKIEREDDDVLYHNGAGEVYQFRRGKRVEYISPVGFYGVLLQEETGFLIQQRFGQTYRFDSPERGGRILSIEDKNQNAIQFSYSEDRIGILDTLGREIVLSVDGGLLRDLTDHAGRRWTYVYDDDQRLVKVTQPVTADFPLGTSVGYAYERSHRLISVTDAKGQRYLVNHYDSSGRVVRQEHGSGVFEMAYELIDGVTRGSPAYRTTCRRKNGGSLVLEHNEVGNVLSTTLQVRQESLAPEDRGAAGDDLTLVKTCAYNQQSELTSRLSPAGNKTEWVYSESEEDPRNQGNLLRITEMPQAGVESEQTSIVTSYEYEPRFQLATSFIDPRGNKVSYQYDSQGNLIATFYPLVTIQPVSGDRPKPLPVSKTQESRYEYNRKGQLLRRTHIDGTLTEYHYYPADDPIGARGPRTATANPDQDCGYLARVVRDASGTKIKNEFAYDLFGNATTVWDGKGNPARRHYNAMGRVETITGREPFKYSLSYRYDANYNEVESAQSFDRLEYDDTTRSTTVTSTELRELKEYDALDNVTQRTLAGGDRSVTEHFIRDAGERIIRQLQPLGNATEYVYDERDLLIERRSGVGTPDAFSERFTYTRNGAVSSHTDGNGNTTTHRYDGFHRYRGFTNPVGTTKTQWFDEAANVVRVAIAGERGGDVPLMDVTYHFDQWDRAYRVDRTWHDPSTGRPLGESRWDGRKGIVSSVLEFGENGLPGKVWTEAANVVGVEYDGAGRAVKIKDLTGEECSFEYDENDNPTLVQYRGPEVEGGRSERVLRRSHDEMDRLVWQQENDEAPERFVHNALGHVIHHVGKSGIEIHHMDDSLGRRVGHAFTIAAASDAITVQEMVRRCDYDDNYRLSSYTDAAGRQTMYRYDALGRQTEVIFPDGNAANVEYDANGNIVREVDQNNNEIINRYDASNRLVERRSHIKKSDKTTVEQYEYDGLSRMVAAIAPDAAIRRTYDSLSRLLTEWQGDHLLQCAHDSAGNLASLVYPGGDEVHKEYDIQNRVTSVKNKAGTTIASFVYRANDQMTKMLLGDAIEADFSYNQQQRLESIEYRGTDNQRLVEGFRYQYDNAGRMTHEIQLAAGSTYGERYYYDDANRAIKAQYGVQNVFDPSRSFEQETSYEHFPELSWKRRVDVDGAGNVIDEKHGTTNQLNRYHAFGKTYFEYDANGNCILKGTRNPGYCTYDYDADNRLIKSECHEANGNKIQTIEYFYDSFGRQVRKVVTAINGTVTEYKYVWAGSILIEEYENGVLVRIYFYGRGATPVRLSVDENGLRKSSYYYTHNGKGVASGLVHERDRHAFAEKYGYELTGASFITEINGVAVPNPWVALAKSDVGNSILSGEWVRDWASGTHSSTGGIHRIPGFDTTLNTLFGDTGGVMGAFRRQIQGHLNTLGLGGGKGAAGAAKQGGLPAGVELSSMAPNWSLYGQEEIVLAPVLIGIGLGIAGNAAYDGTKELIKEYRGDNIPRHTPIVPHPEGNSPGATREEQEQRRQQREAQEEAAREEQDQRRQWREAQEEKNEQAKADKAAEEEALKNAIKDPEQGTGTAMVDPDYSGGGAGGGAIDFPSIQQLEAKLMQNKRPVNPDGGPGSSQIDAPSSKGPSTKDLISYYGDVDAYGGASATPIPGGGYSDPTRPGLAPKPPVSPPPPGTSPNVGRTWP